MKCILILLISFVFGQEQDWDLQRGYDYRGLGEEVPIDTSKLIDSPNYITAEIGGKYRIATDNEGHTFIERISANITLKMLLDYAEECYNDSIQVGWNYYFENDTVYAIPMYALLSYDSTRGDFLSSDALYTRKNTIPTMWGFIEWFKEKQ